MKLEKIIEFKPDEKIVLLERASIIPRMHKIIIAFLLLCAPFFFMFPLFRLGNIGLIIFSAVLIFGAFYAHKIISVWSRTAFVVTNIRAVDIDQRGIFSRVVTELFFSDMNEVSYSIKGVLQTLFRLGTIHIELPGSSSNIEFCHVRNPKKLAELLNSMRERERRRSLRISKLEKTPIDLKRKISRVRELAENLSLNEVEEMARDVREKDRDRDLKELFGGYDDNK
ncbi:MAG: hypothetical protein ACD_76C00142G0010 [uncultured bacterium]|nr:MAG: hypothetical protein ACD_76C00142G0010 [uncultured bacterium]